MKTVALAAVFVACHLAATATSRGQSPVIASFHENGHLSWTHELDSNALYRVEWASQADGPWHAFTYQPMNTMDAHGSTSFEAEVPMFYRVVMATNQPPAGMVWIDGGNVELGQSGMAPIRTNFISGFWMDEKEVTKEKWSQVHSWALTNGYLFDNAGWGKETNHPVHSINWFDAVKWCNARSQKEGLSPCYYTDPGHVTYYKAGVLNISNSWVNWSANGYRLPTEAEWEKAARGGRQRRLFPWGGDTIQHAWANYESRTNEVYDTSPTRGYHPAYTNGGMPYTSAGGSFPANGYGLHDMSGNVLEWCWDWFVASLPGYQTDPLGPETGTNRIMRGGHWSSSANYGRCAYRNMTKPDVENNSIGFRCVRGP